MKVAFDTSVLIAALVSSHRDHLRAIVWLSAVSEGAIDERDFSRLSESAGPRIVVPPDPPAVAF